jgi:hypothetical protein
MDARLSALIWLLTLASSVKRAFRSLARCGTVTAPCSDFAFRAVAGFSGAFAATLGAAAGFAGTAGSTFVAAGFVVGAFAFTLVRGATAAVFRPPDLFRMRAIFPPAAYMTLTEIQIGGVLSSPRQHLRE